MSPKTVASTGEPRALAVLHTSPLFPWTERAQDEQRTNVPGGTPTPALPATTQEQHWARPWPGTGLAVYCFPSEAMSLREQGTCSLTPPPPELKCMPGAVEVGGWVDRRTAGRTRAQPVPAHSCLTSTAHPSSASGQTPWGHPQLLSRHTHIQHQHILCKTTARLCTCSKPPPAPIRRNAGASKPGSPLLRSSPRVSAPQNSQSDGNP